MDGVDVVVWAVDEVVVEDVPDAGGTVGVLVTDIEEPDGDPWGDPALDVGPPLDGPEGVEPEGEAGDVGVPFAGGADIVGVPDEDESFIIVNWGLALPESPKRTTM